MLHFYCDGPYLLQRDYFLMPDDAFAAMDLLLARELPDIPPAKAQVLGSYCPIESDSGLKDLPVDLFPGRCNFAAVEIMFIVARDKAERFLRNAEYRRVLRAYASRFRGDDFDRAGVRLAADALWRILYAARDVEWGGAVIAWYAPSD